MSKHPIPGWLRSQFSRIEDEVQKLGPCGVFTQMRTVTQTYFEQQAEAAQPLACCTPTAEENALLAAGDYRPEELWGVGGKPSCPKCYAAPQPPAEPVVWGSPKTVGQLIRQLQTLDPALETVALYRLPDDIPGVGGKVKQGHISTSYERMEGIWLGPYKGDGRKVLAFWTKLDPRPVPDGEFLTQTPPLGDIYESHAIVAAAYKQLLSALGNEEMSHSDALAAISAKPATAKVDEQKAFEDWFAINIEADEGLTLERSSARPEQYELDETAQIYRGWQARSKLNIPQ
ncbi:hypothetical protein ACTAB2_01825 [Pseudomonas syringae]|uniref:hypothetical protein n=1 Tax=Pseudomonas syringae TaxID=317 RepID=UPI003F799F4D